MAEILKQLPKVNKRYKFAVFGYVRRIQKESSLNIPVLIHYLCLNFYFHGEYFDKCGDKMAISNGLMTLTKISPHSDWDNTCYGKTWIKSNIKQIAQWIFKIDTMIKPINDEMDQIFIYFLSKDNKTNKDCGVGEDNPYFGFSNGGDQDWERIDGVNLEKEEQPLQKFTFKHKDTISVVLDTKNGKITAKKQDDHEMKIIYDDIDMDQSIKYKLGVQLRNQYTSITLLNFSIDYN